MVIKPKNLDLLLSRIHNGNEETVDVEYIGRFIVNQKHTLRVPEASLRQQWSDSVVPIEYFPIYGLKCDRPEMAGGLFDAAPFEPYDPASIQNEYLNLPSPPEYLHELCTDSCGAQFWIGESLTVYGHNLDNEFQKIGAISDFVDFAIEMSLNEQNWHECLRNVDSVSAFRLSIINTMD